MNRRGPDAREKRIALLVGLTLHRRLDGTWAAKSPTGTVYVIHGTAASWRAFRRFVAEVAGQGFRFD
jgi:alpha-beta hydrolase superfamily lysophospholipase